MLKSIIYRNYGLYYENILRYNYTRHKIDALLFEITFDEFMCEITSYF